VHFLKHSTKLTFLLQDWILMSYLHPGYAERFASPRLSNLPMIPLRPLTTPTLAHVMISSDTLITSAGHFLIPFIDTRPFTTHTPFIDIAFCIALASSCTPPSIYHRITPPILYPHYPHSCTIILCRRVSALHMTWLGTPQGCTSNLILSLSTRSSVTSLLQSAITLCRASLSGTRRLGDI
jgi:hypothetical protein